MARYENTLSTLQARTILDYIKSTAPAMASKEAVEDFALEMVEKLENDFSDFFPVNNNGPKKDNPHFSYAAFAFSACARFAIQTGDLRILDYLSILAEVKEGNEKDIHDLGAFGDLFEILVRCAFMRKKALVRWSMLSVKDIKTADISSKKYGIIEVGHNGKTLTFGTLLDYMSGEYTSVVYGVFSEEDKKEVYALCKNKQYDKAIDYICSYSAYWASKYDFQKDMDSLTRGKGITAKACGIQVVYNEGKYNAFLTALDNGVFKSLAETLNQ